MATLAMLTPIWVVVAVAARAKGDVASTIAWFPAAAPFIWALPGIDFGKLCLATAAWCALLMMLILGACVWMEVGAKRKTGYLKVNETRFE